MIACWSVLRLSGLLERTSSAGFQRKDGCVPARNIQVQTAANEISTKEPAKAFDLERAAAEKLKKMGVKVVDNVDKKSFAAIADPYLDKLAKELGPHAEKIKNLIRSIN